MRKVKVCPFLTSVLMSVILILGSFVSLVHASEYPNPTTGNTDPPETERVYEYDGYKVTFSLVSLWNSGYNLNVDIENTGSEPILNWHLSFDYAGEITNIWCAEIQETTDDGYIIGNLGYNMDIAPGGSTSFGISENTPFPGFPENVIIPSGNNETVQNDYSVVYTVENDWSDGSVGNICITNNTGSTINDWSLSFDFDREIISVWGGVIESSENGHYVVRHAVDNPDILPGQSVVFGMICSAGSSGEEPENYELTSYNVGDVQIDDPDVDTDGDGLTDGVEESVGTNPELPDTDGDGLSDYQEIYLTWTDPLLTDTDDNGISDANEDLDGDGLGNLDEIVRGTDTGNPDTDRDDLSDYEEIYVYGTAPLNPDSDGDTLSDGDDVLLGFSPLLPDTDYNGILDCNELVYQTAENDFPLGDGRGITNVSVSMNISGNIEKEVGILNMYDFDVQSREVVGLIGVPMEIRTDETFDSATITFTYDESVLGDTSEEDLALMWYDEENHWYQILDRECVVDTENNTVTYTTTHFSEYFLVDLLKWFSAWNKEIEYSDEDIISHTPSDLDIVYINDGASYSIEDDRSSNLYNAYLQYKFSDRIHDSGRVYFSEGSSAWYNVGNGEKCIFNDNNGGFWTPYFGDTMDSVLQSIIYCFDLAPDLYANDDKIVIIVSDGNFAIGDDAINACIEKGIKIFTIDTEHGANYWRYKRMSMLTGGEYYYGDILDNPDFLLNCIVYDSDELLNTTDKDGDGLLDIYETEGMRTLTGRIITTSTDTKDSDGDTLTDFEETGTVYDLNVYIGKNTYKKCRFIIPHSDPKNIDTDGDDITDNLDPHPQIKEYLEVNLPNRITGIEYLNILDTYNNIVYPGGNQSWWSKYHNYPTDYPIVSSYYRDSPAYRMQMNGCGVIAMTDLELYFISQNPSFSSPYQSVNMDYDNGLISKDDYITYAEYNRDHIYVLDPTYISIVFGAHPEMAYCIENFLRNNGYYQNVRWNGASGIWGDEANLIAIKRMIKNNIPVVFSYYRPGEDLKLYGSIDAGISDGSDFTTINSHYMTIIGYVKFFDKDGHRNKYLLKVVSWGRIYYIDFDYFMSQYDLCTNILEIGYEIQ